MSDQVSWREGRSSALEDERDVAEDRKSRARPCCEGGLATGVRTLDVYDEGLERYFELSSRLAFHRVHGEDGDEEDEALRAELVELDRELSALSRELSLSEIGTLLRDPGDDHGQENGS